MTLYFEVLSGPAGLSQARATVTASRPLSAAGTGLATAGPLPSCSPLPWALPGTQAPLRLGDKSAYNMLVDMQADCLLAQQKQVCTQPYIS